MEKLLSVIIPAYNCKEYLKDCVESILSINNFCKEPFPCELILVDDGSSDGTTELCDEISAEYEAECFAINVIHQTNAGVSAARNRGLETATGEYILFVDSDDTVDAEKMAELFEYIKHDSSIDMAVFGMSFDFYHNAKIYRQSIELPVLSGMKSYSECEELLYELFKCNSLSSLCSRIIRKSIMTDAKIFLREDMFSYEDLEFSLRILSNCENIYFFREPIYRYRQSEDEGNEGRRLKEVDHINEIIENLAEGFSGIDNAEAKNKILISVYLDQAKEKIFISTKEKIDTVCLDFKNWINSNDFLDLIEHNEYAMLIYGGETSKLMSRRSYTKIRHSVANWIKQNFGDFRK